MALLIFVLTALINATVALVPIRRGDGVSEQPAGGERGCFWNAGLVGIWIFGVLLVGGVVFTIIDDA